MAKRAGLFQVFACLKYHVKTPAGLDVQIQSEFGKKWSGQNEQRTSHMYTPRPKCQYSNPNISLQSFRVRVLRCIHPGLELDMLVISTPNAQTKVKIE